MVEAEAEEIIDLGLSFRADAALSGFLCAGVLFKNAIELGEGKGRATEAINGCEESGVGSGTERGRVCNLHVVQGLDETQEGQAKTGFMELVWVGFVEEIEGEFFPGAEMGELLLMEKPLLIAARMPCNDVLII